MVIISDRFLTIVIYDISDNKVRVKMSKLLMKYGYRVQKSAFETYLTNQKYRKLCKEIERLISKNDLVRIYKLSENSLVNIWGDVPLVEDEDYFII